MRNFYVIFLAALSFVVFGCASSKKSPENFRSSEAVPGASPVGEWVLEAALTADVLQAVSAALNAPTANFTADGALAGFTGINRLRAPYAADSQNGTISISPAAMTYMLGLNTEAVAMENLFVSHLGASRFYEVLRDPQGERLILKDGKGKVLLVFLKN